LNVASNYEPSYSLANVKSRTDRNCAVSGPTVGRRQTMKRNSKRRQTRLKRSFLLGWSRKHAALCARLASSCFRFNTKTYYAHLAKNVLALLQWRVNVDNLDA
jgi:hypothetical protein